MRKFIVYTRAVPGCCKTAEVPTIVEVEGEIVTGIEDPSSLWLPQGEFKFRISKPDFLLEMQEIKQVDGTKKKTLVPSVYYNHSIYKDLAQARAAAEKMVHQGLEFEIRKGRATSFTEDELKNLYSQIQEVLL